MGTKVKVNIDSVSTFLASRNLEPGGKAQRVMTNEIYRLSDDYVPFDEHILGTTVTLEADSITYDVPYAKYQWYGKVMAGNPKEATNKDLVYQGAPMRGKEWTNRMMADRGHDVVEAVAKECGGRAK